MDIKAYLKENGIIYKIFFHPPVYTCGQALEYTKEIKGPHIKNLFLKSKSLKFYLAIMPAEKKIDLKEISIKLNEKIGFADIKDMEKILKLSPGSVSPFGLINDKKNEVVILIDRQIWDSDFVSFHPNTNTETLELTKENFQKYLSLMKNPIKILVF